VYEAVAVSTAAANTEESPLRQQMVRRRMRLSLIETSFDRRRSIICSSSDRRSTESMVIDF
jgi:hypothetical protein